MKDKILKFCRDNYRIIIPFAGVLIIAIVLICVIGTTKSGDTSPSANMASVSDNNNLGGENGNVSGNAVSDSTNLSANSGAGFGTGTLNTGNLSETGNGYEGITGTGNFNYGEALQKSLLFYELQRSGDLPEAVRCNWRGDSALNDGSDVGLDLTGGWYDAGDNVKFGLPMAYSAAMLGWSIYEDYDAYEESGQLQYALDNIKWANDYFIKCHPEDTVFYYQIGDGNQDHTYWGAAETVEARMSRPSYAVTEDNPGSAVCAETAASLAICSIVYKDIDSEYSALCLEHAESLYDFSRSALSDAGYTAANGFYDSWSGFYDELAWSGVWLYIATNDETYLDNAESDYSNAGQDYDWAMCWDDVHIGAALMLARLTEDDSYSDAVEKHLDFWTTGTSDGSRITYTPGGLAWLDSWGSLRYATTTSYIAAVYSEWDGCPKDKSTIYWDFAVSQADYALGSTGFSYEIGFGDSYPQNPHHRTAQGSYCDNMNEPSVARHTLYGALVGGPGSNDDYTDEVSNYTTNEVACDYNAGFTGLLAKLYSVYHGQTLVDFGAVEEIPINEYYVQGGINVDGQDFIEVKALICNISAWPATVADNLEFRYYLDLSEVYAAGGDADDITVTTNYMQGGTAAGLVCHDEDNHIYYVAVDFSDTLIYPGGQDNYKKEIQVRIANSGGVWDNSNDPSFVNMTTGGNDILTGTALYMDGNLVFGTEPAAGSNAGSQITYVGNNTSGNGTAQTSGPSSDIADNENVSVSVEYNGLGSNASSISGTLNIVNNSDGSLNVNDLQIKYFFTNEDDKNLTYSCYHTAVNGKNGSYKALSGCNGVFDDYAGSDCDTVCTLSYSDTSTLNVGDTLTISFCINHTDWSGMNTTNDYSVDDVQNICIYSDGKLIFGVEP